MSNVPKLDLSVINDQNHDSSYYHYQQNLNRGTLGAYEHMSDIIKQVNIFSSFSQANNNGNGAEMA